MTTILASHLTHTLLANHSTVNQSRVRFRRIMASAVSGDATTAQQFKDYHPSLEVLGGARDLLCPVIKTHLERPYEHYPVFGSNRHVETIFAAFFRNIPDVKLKRECLRTQDDGTVALDWVSGDARNLPENSAILLLLPGLSGGSDDSYVRHMLVRARNKGWRVVVFNSRGCADSPVTTPQMYSGSFLGDLDEVVKHVGSRYPKANLYGVGWSMGANILVQYLGKEAGARRFSGGSGDSYVRHMLLKARSKGWRVVVFNSRGCGHGPVTTPQFYSASFLGDISEVVAHVSSRYPDSNLYAVGWSLGANILVRYLAQESGSCPLSGAVSLCNPFNLVVADEDFQKGFNIVYNKALSGSLRRIFKKHALLFEEMSDDYNIPAAANCKSIREFDDALTRVSFGFKSVDDYYSKSSSSDSIQHVCQPLLCIQAANDPIAPARGIPREAIKENTNCMLIVTPEGGHLGWIAGDEAPFGAPWTDAVVMDFLEYLEKTKSNSFSKTEENTNTLHATVK